ncbi:type II secretion system F family protein [Stieleria sp. JC731]|uniref:type II secretion system F family protein n=1 Tax=Pirellulaceae TaxID=2691357 RepID=UPI001E3FD262|nr:type II secretion system F family protein [Stieleria sp. JC731]MCC9601694.1 type II secretion system F family protein [Stieleria sp. JC731]
METLLSLQVATVLGVFGFTALVAYVLLSQFTAYGATVHKRMESLYAGQSQTSTKRSQWVDTKKLGELLVKLSRFASFSNLSQVSSLRRRLATAGVRGKNAVHVLLATRGILMIVPAIVATILWQFGWGSGLEVLYIALTGIAAGWLAPIFWLNRTTVRYRQTLKASLPDFLDLVVVCLDAGLSLQDSLRRVAGELRAAHRELALEMSNVQRDIELGSSLDMAMKRLAERTGYEPIQILSTLITEGHRNGSNIADALRSHSDTLRYQREQAAEENAQRASVKIMLPMMVCIFPATFIVLVGPAAIKIYEAFSGNN